MWFIREGILRMDRICNIEDARDWFLKNSSGNIFCKKNRIEKEINCFPDALEFFETLRIWHKPQTSMKESFHVYANDIKEAKKILKLLINYDLFQLNNNIKVNYANVSGLEIYKNGKWEEWDNDEGQDIWKTIREDNN